jgi:uncharacterized protein (UPF0548 family)
MAEWRIGRGWSEEEIAGRLRASYDLPLNVGAASADMTPDNGWNHYHSDAIVGREPPGPAAGDGPFERARVAVANYQFSDPSIVVGHFDADSPLLGRRMLLELKATPVLRFLAGVVVGRVREEEREGYSTFGFRYDTLEGHIERGYEWFLLVKNPHSGEIRFRVDAVWKPGQFPTWWSRLGFLLVGPHYQRRWHHQAHRRLFHIAQGELDALPRTDRFGTAHAGPQISFHRTPRLQTRGDPRWHDEETIRHW